VSNTQRYKGLGNGWTAEVIIHILHGALKDVPRNEEIVVLSMYDGIGTGRYCLEKMGFSNVKYYAYEIDKPAIKVALSNYNDIIEMGDAFAIRNDNWELGKMIKLHKVSTITERDEPTNETEKSNPSGAPEEIKKKITENAEVLVGKAAKEETKAQEKTYYNRLEEPFPPIAQLRKLADERRALAIIYPDVEHYKNDIFALEHALRVLEA
jgi:site-specific DNA-cytosine methylase